MRKSLYVCIVVCLLCFHSDVLYAARHALVIGNSEYEDAPLKNPRNDANALASTLRRLGFLVTKKLDLTQQGMEETFRQFAGGLSQDDTAICFFSGHGAQVNGINYLIPIGIRLYSEEEIKYKAVPLDLLIDTLANANNRMNIIIVDACRDNPFKGFRSSSYGLAPVSAPKETLIAFSTAPGTVAYDNSPEHNSVYTKHLLHEITIADLPIERVFKKVREAVALETGNAQIPWENTSLIGEFSFTSSGSAPPFPSTNEPPLMTPIPTIESLPSPPSRSTYRLVTLEPVPESQLPLVRSTLQQFGVSAFEQKSSSSQQLERHRVAFGLFHSEEEAQAWAETYLKEKNIEYNVYSTKNMYSIQIGQYTDPDQAARVMEDLYQQFSGWNIPVRIELVYDKEDSYTVSVKDLSEAQGRDIQTQLAALEIQTELIID